MQPNSRVLPPPLQTTSENAHAPLGRHQRNRSLSSSSSMPHANYNPNNPSFTPSRQAPRPPLQPSPSTSTPNRSQPALGSYGRFDAQLQPQKQSASTPESYYSHDSRKAPKPHAKKGFGKLFARLGSKEEKHHPAPIDLAAAQQQSPRKQSSEYHHHHHQPLSPKRNAHNIPLAPAAPPPPHIPSIEIGRRKYLHPDLGTGIEENNSLLSSIPAEYLIKQQQQQHQEQQQQQQQQQGRSGQPAQSAERRPTYPETQHRPPMDPLLSGRGQHFSEQKQQQQIHKQLQPPPAPDAPRSPHAQPPPSTPSLAATSSSSSSSSSSTAPSPAPSSTRLNVIQQQQQQQQQQPLRYPQSAVRQQATSYTNTYSYLNPTPDLRPPQPQLQSDHDLFSTHPIEDDLDYDIKRSSRWSVASTGKSSGTYSLYSTFGMDSCAASDTALDASDLEDAEEKEKMDELATIMAARPRTAAERPVDEASEEKGRRLSDERDEARDTHPTSHTPAAHSTELTHDGEDDGKNKAFKHVVEGEDDEDGNDDNDDDDGEISSSDDDDLFYDASGFSQEEMEREKLDKKRLSKRLSGGHFGSAGGLMLSIQQAPPPPPPPPVPMPVPPLVLAPHNEEPKEAEDREEQDEEGKQEEEEEEEEKLAEKEEENRQEEREEAGSKAKAQEQQIEHVEELKPPAQTSLPPPPRPNMRRGRSTSAAKQLKDLPIDSTEARQAAQRLWNEDTTFVAKDRMAEWLGQRKPVHSAALVYYMDYFDFKGMQLDSAFRKLCSRLYFKAETQQIDRILEVFAQRYWRCNPMSIFGDADIVYAVVYSLLLLNTDLHVAQGNHAKMPRQAFVRNTMATIRDQRIQRHDKHWEAELETYLKDLYMAVKQNQILQPMANQQQQQQQQQQLSVSTTAEKRSSMLSSRRVGEFKRSVLRKTYRESTVYPEDEPPLSASTSPGPSSPLGSPRRESFSSNTSATTSLSKGNGTLSPHMMHYMNTHATDLFANRPPYLKEGVVARKHLLESGNQKAKHRDWKEAFLVVGHGELRMYSTQGAASEDRRSLMRVSGVPTFATLADSLSSNTSATNSASSVVGSGHPWTTTMPLLGSIKLNHSLSNVLPPPGYNRQRPHVFAIQQSHGGVYLFHVGSQEQANEWVDTCNYWAARQSKEPLPGGVSNMEYGWGACLNDVILNLDSDEVSGQYVLDSDPDSVTIYDWQPPTSPAVASTLDEKEQHEALQKHLQAISEEINEHRELKRKILVKFPTSSKSNAKVMTNWERKSNYLLAEIIKYQNYCDVLEKSMRRRQQLVAEQQQKGTDRLEYQQQSSLDLISEIGKELQHLSIK